MHTRFEASDSGASSTSGSPRLMSALSVSLRSSVRLAIQTARYRREADRYRRSTDAFSSKAAPRSRSWKPPELHLRVARRRRRREPPPLDLRPRDRRIRSSEFRRPDLWYLTLEIPCNSQRRIQIRGRPRQLLAISGSRTLETRTARGTTFGANILPSRSEGYAVSTDWVPIRRHVAPGIAFRACVRIRLESLRRHAERQDLFAPRASGENTPLSVARRPTTAATTSPFRGDGRTCS